VGYLIAKSFRFPDEVAAGIILIGCCPSGLASNVMCFLAKANLALSVTVTAVSTLLAPLLTPLLMQLLAGSYIKVDFWAMVWHIHGNSDHSRGCRFGFSLPDQGPVQVA
jgi:bile acid:Na+ symporter, BASS family